MTIPLVFILTAALSFLALESHAHIFSSEVTLQWPNKVHQLTDTTYRFGFLPGGEAQILFQCNAYMTNSSILLCTKRESEALDSMSGAGTVCDQNRNAWSVPSAPFIPSCTYFSPVRGWNGQASIVVNSKIFVHAYFLSCGTYNQSVSCNVQTILLNPGGEHLSSDQISIPRLYSTAFIVWCSILFFFFINWAFYYRYSNRLHKLILFLPVINIFLCIARNREYNQLSSQGYEGLSNEVVREILATLQHSVLFLILLLISEAWGIMISSFGKTKLFVFTFVISLFFISTLCYVWVHPYFLAVVISISLLILFLTLKSTTCNMNLLLEQRLHLMSFLRRHQIRYRGELSPSDVLEAKFLLLRWFRFWFILFTALFALSQTVGTFLVEFRWIDVAMGESLRLAIATGLLFLFRMRNFRAFDSIELIPPETPLPTKDVYDSCLVISLPSASAASAGNTNPSTPGNDKSGDSVISDGLFVSLALPISSNTWAGGPERREIASASSASVSQTVDVSSEQIIGMESVSGTVQHQNSDLGDSSIRQISNIEFARSLAISLPRHAARDYNAVQPRATSRFVTRFRRGRESADAVSLQEMNSSR